MCTFSVLWSYCEKFDIILQKFEIKKRFSCYVRQNVKNYFFRWGNIFFKLIYYCFFYFKLSLSFDIFSSQSKSTQLREGWTIQGCVRKQSQHAFSFLSIVLSYHERKRDSLIEGLFRNSSPRNSNFQRLFPISFFF